VADYPVVDLPHPQWRTMSILADGRLSRQDVEFLLSRAAQAGHGVCPELRYPSFPTANYVIRIDFDPSKLKLRSPLPPGVNLAVGRPACLQLTADSGGGWMVENIDYENVVPRSRDIR